MKSRVPSLCVFLFALLGAAIQGNAQLQELETIMEGLDGMQLDITGPVDATSLPNNLRAWAA